MTNFYTKMPKRILLLFFFFSSAFCTLLSAQSFSQSLLDYNDNGRLTSGTSLMFGPDGRLYATEYTGRVRIFDIERLGPGNYVSQGRETLDDIRDIQDHNDDGSLFSSRNRETIGLVVVGTAENPVIYVSSSDFRIGGGPSGGSGDSNLDTNSGIITRFTRNGNSWDVVDIVRGLPRSEENHATNGLEFVTVNGRDYLIAAQGGHTNAGAPSTNFNWTTEYALSGAVLSIDLTALEALPILNDNGRDYIYDLPTLDDPTRDNVNGITDPDAPDYDGIDVNDPWGGNDGLNQAIIVPGGPVQIFSPGFRNAYDLVITQSGAVYITDNGANAGWGGFPPNEGNDGTATNDYDLLEPGSSSPSGGEEINNEDHLTRITLDIQNYIFGSFYGGHPNPVRSNPQGAGLFTAPTPTSLDGAVFRTQVFDPDGSTAGSTTDPSVALPANWPPLPIAEANPAEGDWRGPGLPNPDGDIDDIVTIWSTNTNGIAEYTASNFGGAMQGDLIAGSNQNGNLRRVQFNPDGTLEELTQEFASGLGGNTLGVSCNSDTDPFPGTIWVTNFGINGITVLEPQDMVDCIAPGEEGYDPLADYDQDGYTNQDEEDNGTDPCNGGSQPDDFDALAGGTLISDLNDTDDDFDGILDANDPFQLGNPLAAGTDAFSIPIENELFSNNPTLGGYLGLGFTGMMNNGNTAGNWLDWIDRRDDPNDPNPNDILGGAIGAMTMQMTVGTALGSANTQEKAFQYGIQSDITTGTFTIMGGIANFAAPRQLYGNDAAPNGEIGFFIGDGTQSNYIKFVLTRNGFLGVQEINDIVVDTIELPIALGDRPSGAATLYFVVDSADGTVSLEYVLDSGIRTVMTGLTAQGSILTAIQQTNQDLAVGLIGTSNATGAELEGTWDVLSVLNSIPFITQGITESNANVGQTNDTFDLDTVFGDDNGVANLTYSIFNNTNTENVAGIVGNILTIEYATVPAISEITIRATDTEGNFVDHIVTVTVTDNPTVLYRVNAGGPEIAAIDGSIAWSADLAAPNNSEFLIEAASDEVFGFPILNFTPEVNLTTTPQDIFQTERYDDVAGAPNMTYSFPVTEVGNYEVRLYIANGFDGTDQVGDRIFDVTIEGITYPLLDEIDLIARYGHQTGTVISHTLNVSDGNLDISFVHSLIENPLVNGIEILAASNNDTPIYVNALEDQVNEVGEQLNGGLIASAFGGDGNLNYSLSGQPLGITIDPTNGQIGGTIDQNIVLENPYTVTLTVDDSDDITSDAVTVTFTWIATRASNVLYRVNAGGPEIPAIDGALAWGEDTTANNSPFLTAAGTDNVFGFTLTDFTPEVDQTTTPLSIFDSERFDQSSAAPDMTYSFPITQNGAYEVRIYLGNGFDGTSGLGVRFFDILIEGNIVQDDFDPIAEFGDLTGGVLTFDVTVTDGSLDIVFDHQLENPFLNAIEILNNTVSDAPITVNSIADQTNVAGATLDGNLEASATGGQGAIQYSAQGLPPGISLNATTGQFSGTIDLAAATNSPYAVTVTVDDSDADDTDTVTTAFIWSITEPSNVLYRINAGGPEIPAIDGDIAWAEDTTDNNSPFLIQAGTDDVFGFTLTDFTAEIDQTTTPLTIFDSERFDLDAVEPDMTYAFPITNPGNYEVRVYLGNGFEGTSGLGVRFFDILMEGNIVADDFDPIAAFGNLTGGVLTFEVEVIDGTLDIVFDHQLENPFLNAIEVLRAPTPDIPIVIDAFADQLNEVNTVLDGSLGITASGGDGDLSYSAASLPTGLSIDESTGLISGTLTPDAYINSPYTVVVTVNDTDANAEDSVTTEFEWRVTPVWTDLNEDQNYTARHENSFVQAGDRFYLMGGRENANTIDVYDYTNNTWEALTDITPIDPDDPTRRLEFNHFQATEYQGLIWVIGAFQTNNFPSEVPANFIWIFDPVNLEWIQGPEIPEARRRGSAGLAMFNDKFYVLGGNTDGHDGGFVPWFDEYDPSTGIWTVLEDAPNARDHFSAVVLEDTLYAAAGRLSGGDGGVFAPTVPEVDQYDFVSGVWTTLPAAQNIPTPRAGAATVGYNNQLIVIGGESLEQNSAFATTEAFDPGLGEWITLDNLNNARQGTQAILSGEGIFTLGGSPNRGGGNQRNLEVLGVNAPIGEANFSGPVVAPEAVVIDNGTAVDITFNGADYTYGFFVRSIAISGPSAANFEITAGDLTNSVIVSDRTDGFTHTVTVALDSETIGNAAVLTINYGANSSIEIDLSDGFVVDPDVVNPGDQLNTEGELVALQIAATDITGDLTYSATNLPPGLTIDAVTGLISGTVQGTTTGGAFMEQGGLVVIEAESGTLEPGWSSTGIGGTQGIFASEDHLNDRNGGTIPYEITINTPGVYRFNWRSLYNGTSSTDQNDSWLRFPNNNGVWFFGFQGSPGSEAALISNVQGAQNNIVFPSGSGRQTTATRPEGATGNGFFKIYRSGGSSGVYDWQARTSDSDAHDIYVWFENAGTFTMEISERSAGHAIDKVALYRVDGPNFSNNQLTAANESARTEMAGAAANSPYDVSVNVQGVGSSSVDFIWTIEEPEIGIIWIEDFEGLANGTTVDNGATAWSSARNGGVFEVTNGAFLTNADSNGPGVWTSEVIQIDGTASISIDVNDGDDNKENADFVRVSYRVDGGPLVIFGEVRDDINAQTLVAENINGSTLQIVVESDVSFSNEFYTIDNVTVSGNIVPRPEFALVVDNGVGDGNFTEGTEVAITADAPPIGEEFDAWTGDIGGVADVNAPSTVLTMPASNVTLTATYREIPSTGIVWIEDFEDLPNGTTVDNGATAWSSTRNGGIFEVSNGSFITSSNSTGPGIWTSEIIAINGIVSITIDVNDGDNNKETADFVRASYRVDGGPLILFGEVRDDISAQIFTANNIAGNTIQIVVEADVSFTDEIYSIDNITVLGQGTSVTNTAPVAIANASSVSGNAPVQIDFTGSNSTDDAGIVSYEWNFDDGSTSTEIDPSHTFVNPGVYNVSLRVVDAEGLEDTTALLITVDAAPVQDGVVSFTLVDAITNQDLLELTDGMQIDAFSIQGLTLTIRANTNIPVRSVRLEQSGPLSRGRTENIAPYALFGDQSGDYFGRLYPTGDYTISATSFSERSLGGIQGPTLSISFSIVPQAALGISETELLNNEIQLQLFPNPVISDAQIRVVNAEVEMEQINVFDITGRLIQQHKATKVRIAEGRYQFNVSNLDNGLYFINMTAADGESHTMRMVISK